MDPHCKYVSDDQQRVIQVTHTNVPTFTIDLGDNCPKIDPLALLLALQTTPAAVFPRPRFAACSLIGQRHLAA